jgi:hypothetical protein
VFRPVPIAQTAYALRSKLLRPKTAQLFLDEPLRSTTLEAAAFHPSNIPVVVQEQTWLVKR